MHVRKGLRKGKLCQLAREEMSAKRLSSLSLRLIARKSLAEIKMTAAAVKLALMTRRYAPVH